MFQKDSAVIYTNIINGAIFFAAVIIISKIIYDSHFDQMYKNIKLEEANTKLNYMSNHDPLTGLANRRNFEIQIKHKMNALKDQGKSSALLLLDIDHFKLINDQFGHPIGDILLKKLSSILVKNIRSSDLVTRWGGEEFLIILFETSIDEAYESADKIRIAVEKEILEIDNFKINITISLGIALLNGDFSSNFDTSYKLADNALYKAKSQGRNQIVKAPLNK